MMANNQNQMNKNQGYNTTEPLQPSTNDPNKKSGQRNFQEKALGGFPGY